MLFHVLLASAMQMVEPASPQQPLAPLQNPPTPATGAPMTGVPAPSSSTTTPVQATPAQPAPVAAAQPTPADTEVVTIVAREFPAYDTDKDGTLSAAEFAAWMVRLKTIADPALRPDAPSTRTWVGAAFAQADVDRSRSVTLPELTGFLIQTG